MHNHPPILALGFSEAAMFLRGSEGHRVDGIISIHGEQEAGIEGAAKHRLDLHFDDAEAPDSADIVASYQARMRLRREAENGRQLRPPTPEDARTIIQFAGLIARVDGIVLCHCGGGVSRSPAAAILCLAVWTGPGNEKYAVDYIRQARPCAFPHPDIIRFGDLILNRSGQLVAANDLISRGKN